MAESDWEYWFGPEKELTGNYMLPLSILQLDPSDRAVLRIAGES